MRDFESRPLAETIAEAREGAKLWIFVHIPKTAGSSLSHLLGRHAAPYRNIHPGDEDANLPHTARLSQAASRFIEETQSIDFQSCSGHLRPEDHQRIADAVEGARLVTFLRNPVERVISDYRYSRTPAHPQWREVIQEFPTFESYIEHPQSQDKMWRFLARDRRASIGDCIAQIERDFAFVGLLGMFPMSVGVLFRMIADKDIAPGKRVRRTKATPDNRVEVSPELRKRIAELNRRDFAIVQHFRAKLLAKRPEWVAMRDADSGGELNPTAGAGR